MKNVQVIDGAMNCKYDIFSFTDAQFKLIFPHDRDVEFIKDFLRRAGKQKAEIAFKNVWKRRVDKKTVNGIHGTLFYQLEFKRQFYPTKKEAEMIANPKNKPKNPIKLVD
jgi:hypothetical protein